MSFAAGSRADAYARVRAWKSRLLSRQDVVPLFTAADAVAMRRVESALGIGSPVERLVRVYRMTLRHYRDAAPLLLAMLRLHEIENVKLLWRTVVLRRDVDVARRLWIPLGPLATVREDTLQATTTRDLAERLARTPYASIAMDVARAHADDVGAAELAFDRWASQRLLDEAQKLPPKELLARKLVQLVVLERDSEILRRGERWFGLSPAASRTAAATRAQSEDAVVLRRRRLRLCHRAFLGDPFALAPAIALVLLAEAEARGIRALIERAGDVALDGPLARVLAGAPFES